MARNCKEVTFKRGPKTKTGKKGRLLPKSQWKTVTRCEGRKLSTKAKKRWDKQKGKVICRNNKTGVFTRCARAKRKR